MAELQPPPHCMQSRPPPHLPPTRAAQPQLQHPQGRTGQPQPLRAAAAAPHRSHREELQPPSALLPLPSPPFPTAAPCRPRPSLGWETVLPRGPRAPPPPPPAVVRGGGRAAVVGGGGCRKRKRSTERRSPTKMDAPIRRVTSGLTQRVSKAPGGGAEKGGGGGGNPQPDRSGSAGSAVRGGSRRHPRRAAPRLPTDSNRAPEAPRSPPVRTTCAAVGRLRGSAGTPRAAKRPPSAARKAPNPPRGEAFGAPLPPHPSAAAASSSSPPPPPPPPPPFPSRLHQRVPSSRPPGGGAALFGRPNAPVCGKPSGEPRGRRRGTAARRPRSGGAAQPNPNDALRGTTRGRFAPG